MSRGVSFKTVGYGADVTFCEGRVFHSLEAETGKAGSPMVERRMQRTISDYDKAEKRLGRQQTTGGIHLVYSFSFEIKGIIHSYFYLC